MIGSNAAAIIRLEALRITTFARTNRLHWRKFDAHQTCGYSKRTSCGRLPSSNKLIDVTAGLRHKLMAAGMSAVDYRI